MTIYRYNQPSTMTQTLSETKLSISGSVEDRPQVHYSGRVTRQLLFRDALLTMRDVVVSDFRPKIDPVKREAYFRWLNRELDRLTELEIERQEVDMNRVRELQISVDTLRQELNELNSKLNRERILRDKIRRLETRIQEFPSHEINSVLSKHRIRLRAMLQEGEIQFQIYDPVITVHPDRVYLEALSLDASSYVSLSLPHDNFEILDDMEYGTTNIDFSDELAKSIEKIRSTENFYFTVDAAGVELSSETESYFEKKVDLPENWIKGFLQISSAMMFNDYTLSLEMSDVLNIITILKQNPPKFSPKAMIFHLIPGQPVKVELEPFDVHIPLSHVYRGDTSQSIKIWTRNRFKLLERVLPQVKSINLHLLGNTLPVYLTIDLEIGEMVIGFSSWTANSWSSTTFFSALSQTPARPSQEIIDYLDNVKVGKIEELEEKFNPQDIRATVTHLFSKGRACYDPTAGAIRYRTLDENLPHHLIQPSIEEVEGLELLEHVEGFEITVNEEDLQVASASIAGQMCEIVFSEIGTPNRSSCNCKFASQQNLPLKACGHLTALHLRKNFGDKS